MSDRVTTSFRLQPEGACQGAQINTYPACCSSAQMACRIIRDQLANEYRNDPDALLLNVQVTVEVVLVKRDVTTPFLKQRFAHDDDEQEEAPETEKAEEPVKAEEPAKTPRKRTNK